MITFEGKMLSKNPPTDELQCQGAILGCFMRSEL